MANIGSEVHRTVKWKRKDNEAYWRKAFERARELIDLTIDDEKNRHGLREIVRVREAHADHFVFDNEYHTTDENWLRYFDAFTRAARVGKRAQANCSGSGSEQRACLHRVFPREWWPREAVKQEWPVWNNSYLLSKNYLIFLSCEIRKTTKKSLTSPSLSHTPITLKHADDVDFAFLPLWGLYCCGDGPAGIADDNQKLYFSNTCIIEQ